MEFYPFKFTPIYKERIWGGRSLQKVFNKPLPNGKKIGESWELADLPDDKSVISNGVLVGQTLKELIKKYPAEITGNANFKLPFPLLIKLLDARDVLSVQVHPDAATCRRLNKGDAKTECWYIIDAEPGAVIYKGLKPGVSKERFAEAIKTGTVAEMLNRIEVHIGQCHFLPAGTTHAIGAGLLIAEIQTPSDTTYRVFDWNRLGADGKARPLHITDAMESIHFDSSADKLTCRSQGRLVDCDFFKIDKNKTSAEEQAVLSENKMEVLIILGGAGRITADDIEPVDFTSGDTLLIPAAFQGIMHFFTESEYLSVAI